MKKLLLTLLSVSFLGLSAVAESEERMPVAPTINMVLKHRQVNVTGANGMEMKIYSLTGVHIASVQVESQDARIKLQLPKGCYLLKVGNVVRKVHLP